MKTATLNFAEGVISLASSTKTKEPRTGSIGLAKPVIQKPVKSGEKAIERNLESFLKTGTTATRSTAPGT